MAGKTVVPRVQTPGETPTVPQWATRRYRVDIGEEQKAMIAADYFVIGPKMTYRSWEIPRKTMYNYVKRCKKDPEFAARVQKYIEKTSARIEAERESVHLKATRALFHKLGKGDAKLDEYVNAYVHTAKVAGTHEGDNKAIAGRASIGSSGNAPSLGFAVPLILTTPRPDVPNPAPVMPPPADD